MHARAALESWRVPFATLPALAATPAFAHHAMDSATPGTLFEGLVSGLAHPVIGLDHLLFVLAIGAVCCYHGGRRALPAVFIAGTLAGTLLHLRITSLPYTESAVALTLLVLGALLFRAGPRRGLFTGLLAVSGIVHGYAYGEAIVGAEPTPLVAYLAGFAAGQYGIAVAGFHLAQFVSSSRAQAYARRAWGGMLTVAGAAFIALSIVSG